MSPELEPESEQGQEPQIRLGPIKDSSARASVDELLQGLGGPATPPAKSTTTRQPQQGNLVILPNGSKHLFPAGTTVEQMHKALNLGPVKDQENWVDKVRPWIASGAGIAGAAGAGLVTKSPALTLAAETQSYALVDSLLKYLGASPPKSYTEAITGSEADAAINAVAGKLIGGVFKGVKGFFNAGMPEFYQLAPTTSQGLERYGMKALATVPKFLEDYGVPGAKAAALDRAGGKGFTQALAHANTINGRMAGTNSNPQLLYDNIKGQLQLGLSTGLPIPGSPGATLHKLSQEAIDLLEKGGDHFEVLRNTIAKVDDLSKVLKIGSLAGSPAMNVKQDLAAFKFMDIINKATIKDAKGNIRIDPGILADSTPGSGMWNDPQIQSSFNLLYGKAGKEKITEFFKDIAYTQASQGTNPALGKYLRYGSTAGKFIIGIGALQHAISTGSFSPMVVPVGVQVSASAIGRMLMNPRTSRTITEMAKGIFKENPAWSARMIGTALRNQVVGVVGANGSTSDGTIEEDPDTGDLKLMPVK